MVLINKAINEVTVKLVYYGPGLCGKTTNLEKVYGNPKLENKGKMISMATETDRTLFFDFMPMELGTIAGQKIRVQLYTVPGQVFYDATRKLVLRGADGVVFVADSQATMKESNLDSLENLKTNLRLNRIDPDKIALVFQYNKRDLPNAASVEEMNEYMNPGNAPVVEAVAFQGVGVTQTLRQAVSRILENLKNKVDLTLYDEPRLTAPKLGVKSGVPTGPGTTKVSVGGRSAPPAPVPMQPAAAPVPAKAPAPFEPQDAGTFDSEEAEEFADVAAVAVEDESDPFGASATELQEEDEDDSPFASARVAASGSIGGAALASPLESAREIVRSLESALEIARNHERMLSENLGK